MNRKSRSLYLKVLFYLVEVAVMSSRVRVDSLANNSNVTLYFGVFISQESDFDFSGFIPPLELGVMTINDNQTILKGLNGMNYYIEYEPIANGKCEAPASLRGFFDQITNLSAPKIMLIGSDCSVSTEPVAEISHHWNLVQISQSSSSPRLSNTIEFPKFLRTVSSDIEIARGISPFMKHFSWSRVALLTQSENIFTYFSTGFKEHIVNSDLQFLGEFSFNTNDYGGLLLRVNELQNSPARIIFLNMYELYAAQVICWAYERRMIYPDYVWMVHNWYNIDWWMNRTNSSCTIDDMKAVLTSQIVLDHYPRINEEDKNRTNIGGVSWESYKTFYDDKFNESFSDTEVPYNIDDGAYMFDTVWAAALALHKTAAKLPDGQSLLDFNYSNTALSKMIYEEALNVKFFGLTGEVCFDGNGDRPGWIRLLQYRDNGTHLNKVPFAAVQNDQLQFLSEESSETVYGGNIPVDESYDRISLGLFIAYTILSIIGIIFACVCLVFNLWFRNQRLVKLSSPYVNVMIIAGAILFYVAVILFGVDENIASFPTVDGLCHAKVWLCVIGFSLLFGTIFAKAWRIYYIFNHWRPNKKVEITDCYLFAIVAVLLVSDIVFMLPPTVTSRARLRREERELEGVNDGDLPVIVGICASDDSLTWLIVLFAYKGCVLIFGVYLAFETRKVKIVSLNESRFIGMAVYGAVIVSVALTPIGFFLEDIPDAQYGILGIMMWASITIILILVFVSKMYKVYRDPEGKSVMATNSITTMYRFQGSDDMYKEENEKLKKEIAHLKKKLNKKDKDGTIRIGIGDDYDKESIKEEAINRVVKQ